MAAKNVGTLIKEARTKAGLTQEQLAKKVKGLTASDIGKAERGEKTLTQEQLKAIAKATGVTQKSLLEAKSGGSSGKTASSSSGVKLTADEKKLVTLFRKADDKTKQAAMELLDEGAEETGSILSGLLGGNSAGPGIGGVLGTLLGGGNSGGSGNLITSLFGGNNNNNNNNADNGGGLLGSLIGGVLGKREMPDGEEPPEDNN
ncbi:MAG: helix-turn-helix transcriptional regulator [Clostridia bacterium]|nr:helix-turn-helix transcriptional regulator [Clostridia bacterium]